MGQGNAAQAANRILKLRRRLDLEIYPQRRRAQQVWVIKDPLSLRYFQFRGEEFAVLQWLDGRSSLEQIKERFERRFAPHRMSLSRLHGFVTNLHRNGLVISDAPGQGAPLLERYDRQRRDSWMNSIANPFAIRFRGFDPSRFLDRIYPSLRWIFSPRSYLCCTAIVFTALMLLISRLDTLALRLPETNALLSPHNLLLLAVAMATTKFIHEMGHALACKHFGGRCHELGIMLLVFTPCLYCNVTDAWKLSNRWHRVAIGAAGIMVEIILASICTILWFYSQPGLFHTLCLNVMLVCSVGTVLLNGNPLLRYDGYYILSDVLEQPNLWQDSRTSLSRLASRIFLGVDPGKPISMQGRPAFLLAFAIASMAYRTLVVGSILYLIYRVCKPEGLLLVAQILTALMLGGILLSPVTAISRMMTNPILRQKFRPRRILWRGGAAIALVAACFMVPLPCRITAPSMIEPRDARGVYVAVPGRLTQSVAVGMTVKAGQPLAQLSNIEIQRELERVQGLVSRQQLRVQNLESMRGTDAALAAQLPAAKEILADLNARLIQLKRDQSSLVLTAPTTGTVLPPPSVTPSNSDALHLASWSGTPMDPRNLGTFLERNTLYCLVGPKDEFEAAVYVDQSDVSFIRPNQPVRLALDIGGGKIVTGTVTQVSQVNLQSVPTELAIDQQLANRADASGVRRPESTTYKTHVKLDPTDVPLLIGARGRAKIEVQWQPLSKRMYRFFLRTFKTVI